MSGKAEQIVVTAGVRMLATVCHAANAAYCRSLGDDSQKPWEDAPEWQRTSAVNGVLFHLANPEAGDAASHESWMAEKQAAGWKYGETKDEKKKEHPCMVPFEELPKEQQFKDALFRTLVHAGSVLVDGFDQGAQAYTDAEVLKAENGTLKRQLAAQKGQTTRARSELTEVLERNAADGPRKLPETVPTLKRSELLELIDDADDVCVVAFIDDVEELRIPPLGIHNGSAAFKQTGDGLCLALEKWEVGGPALVSGWALYLDGELIAYRARPAKPGQLTIGGGQTYNLAGDVIF